MMKPRAAGPKSIRELRDEKLKGKVPAMINPMAVHTAEKAPGRIAKEQVAAVPKAKAVRLSGRRSPLYRTETAFPTEETDPAEPAAPAEKAPASIGSDAGAIPSPVARFTPVVVRPEPKAVVKPVAEAAPEHVRAEPPPAKAQEIQPNGPGVEVSSAEEKPIEPTPRPAPPSAEVREASTNPPPRAAPEEASTSEPPTGPPSPVVVVVPATVAACEAEEPTNQPPEPAAPTGPEEPVESGNELLIGRCRRAEAAFVANLARFDVACLVDTLERVREQSKDALAALETGLQAELKEPVKAEELLHFSRLLKDDQIVAADAKPNLVDIDSHLQSLREAKMKHPAADLWVHTLDGGIEQLKRAEQFVRSGRLHSAAWASAVAPATQMLHTLMSAAKLETHLVKNEEQLKRIKFDTEAIAHAQATAIADGDIATAEEQYYLKLEAQEQLHRVIGQRISLLDELREQLIARPMQSVREVHNHANVVLDSVLHEQLDLKQRAQAELQSLRTGADKLHQERRQQTEQFQLEFDNLEGALQTNRKKQDECFAKIQELFSEIEQLSMERTVRIERRIELLSVERNAQAVSNHCTTFVREREAELQRTLRTVEISEELTETAAEYVSAMCNDVETWLRHREEELETERLATHQRSLEHFRAMYLTLGEVTYRKENNLRELENKIELARIQQEVLMDSLNPAAKEVADQRKQMEALREEMRGKIGALHSKSDTYIERFRITESALATAGIEFKHPAEELNEINEKRKLKILEYRQLTPQVIEEGESAIAFITAQPPPATRMGLLPTPTRSGGPAGTLLGTPK